MDQNSLKNAARMRRIAQAKQRHDHWRPVLEDAYDYCLPQRESFYENVYWGERRGAEVYDETAVVGLQEFASQIQAGMVPANSRWADLEAGTQVDEAQRMEVNQALAEITEAVFEVIQGSNFNQEITESLVDLGIGTGVMVIDETDDPQMPINCRAIALPQMHLLAGPDDKLTRFYWYRKLTAEDVKFLYANKPGATIPSALQQKIDNLAKQTAAPFEQTMTFIEAVEKDYDAKDDETWDYFVWSPDHKCAIYEEQFKGEGSNPYLGFRWSKSAGETLGRGPVLNAMAAIKTTNLTVQLILENAEMSISGLWAAPDDADLNPETTRLNPGTVNIYAADSAGLQNLTPNSNFNVADLVLRDMRLNIKRALYNDMLGDPDKTPASATEVAARQAELANRMGAAFGRLQTELVDPAIKRVVYIMKKKGLIKLPKINGREVKIKAISPLAQAQHQKDIVVLDQFYQMLAARFGPQVAMAVVKQDQAIPYLAKRFNVPENLLRKPEEIAAIIQQLQDAAQQNPEGMAQATEMAKAARGVQGPSQQ